LWKPAWRRGHAGLLFEKASMPKREISQLRFKNHPQVGNLNCSCDPKQIGIKIQSKWIKIWGEIIRGEVILC
jgi:hypothetical protein